MPRGDRRPGPKPPTKLEAGQTWWRNNSMVDGAERAVRIIRIDSLGYVSYRYLCGRRCPGDPKHAHRPVTVREARFWQLFHTIGFC